MRNINYNINNNSSSNILWKNFKVIKKNAQFKKNVQDPDNDFQSNSFKHLMG